VSGRRGSRPSLYTCVQDSRRANPCRSCGNLSSAVGPFAVDEGVYPRADGEALIRIHNTNTGGLIHASFAVRDGCADPEAVRVGNPSGVVQVGARVTDGSEGWRAESAALYRTARSLMRGAVAVPAG
jgi:2-methylaconitate cis-trans-isomerase PrpF